MTLLHIINAIAWGANTVVWLLYTGSVFMGLASAVAAGAAIYMAWSAQ